MVAYEFYLREETGKGHLINKVGTFLESMLLGQTGSSLSNGN